MVLAFLITTAVFVVGGPGSWIKWVYISQQTSLLSRSLCYVWWLGARKLCMCVCTCHMYVKCMSWAMTQSYETVKSKDAIPYRSSVIWCQGNRMFFFLHYKAIGILLSGASADFVLNQCDEPHKWVGRSGWGGSPHPGTGLLSPRKLTSTSVLIYI